LGFWGINASAHVSFSPIPETSGTVFQYVADVASGARNLKQYASCPNFKDNSETAEAKVLH
jgi:hypothetical protein